VSGAILAGSASGNVLFACLSDGRVYRGDLDGHWASNGIPVGGQCNGLAADPRDGQVTQNSSIAIYQTPAGNLEVSIIDHSSGTKQNLGFAERAGPRGSGRPGVWVVPANFTEPTGVAYDIFAADGLGFYRYLHPGWSARFDLHDDTWWMAFPSSHQAISVVDRLYAFAEGSDGQLWVNWWDGSQWQWSAQGMPPGATIAGAVGTLVANQSLYDFVRSADGHLWVNWWDGSAWQWGDLGTPTGASVSGSIGTFIATGTLLAFVRGSDGHLWDNYGSGSTGTWEDQGTPPGATVAGSVGTLTFGLGSYVFVHGSDGHLWLKWHDGSKWQPWSDQGTPPGATIAAGVGGLTADQTPYAFVRSTDGRLWVRWYNGSNWVWSAQGKPPTATVVDTIGMLTVDQRPYVFVRGSDGQLWVNWWDGSQWQWSAQGMPPGATVADTVGTLTVGRRPHVFVRGSDGQLWINWYDGSSWRWTNQGTPPGATLVRGGGALKILNSGPAYAADDGGIQFDAGNLEWVGASHGLHAIFSIKISGYYRSDSSTSDCPVYNDDGELCPTLFLPSADDDTFIRSTGVGQPTIYDWDNFNDYLGDSGEVLIDPAQPSHALAVRNLTYMMFVNPDGTAPPFSKSAFQHYADE